MNTDGTVQIITRALGSDCDTGMGNREPIIDVYTAEGVALIIRERLADAGLLVTDERTAVIVAAGAWAQAAWWGPTSDVLHDAETALLDAVLTLIAADVASPPS